MLRSLTPRQRATATNNSQERKSQPYPGISPVLVVRCREVIPETIYTQTTKTDSADPIYIFAHTHIYVYMHMTIILKDAINLKGAWRDWREEPEGSGRKEGRGESDIFLFQLKTS